MTDGQEPRELGGAEAVREACIELVTDARRSVHIHSRDMDSALYDDGRFLDALTRFLISHPRAFARVLVQDATTAIREGHRLIGLAQRLSSRFAIREPGPQHRDYNAAFLVTDGTGVLYRELGDRFDAVYSRHDRARARQLVRYHDEAWEFGQPNPNLRNLNL